MKILISGTISGTTIFGATTSGATIFSATVSGATIFGATISGDTIFEKFRILIQNHWGIRIRYLPYGNTLTLPLDFRSISYVFF